MLYSLDAIRLMCPMPVIRLSQKINELEVGDTVEITATDPGVKHDIPAWCRVHGHNVLDVEEKGDQIILLVEKNTV
ncbi:MAG TPA: recombinase [Candidatus Thioglobus sp.]|jgi:tRNA 2-thiouridine synthesizing protein A|nr:recombinase [Candidatus Thioglobus sp.]HIL21589.1 recombinase [Candidatus Thioglobus sp.]